MKRVSVMPEFGQKSSLPSPNPMLNVPVSSFLAVVSFLFGVAAVASLLSHLQVVEWRVSPRGVVVEGRAQVVSE
eukprot:m.454622 g.454622  ORF g.454622 m.454622 type:complete len:74 (+) comp20709_c0_seq1:970-1191(+)